MLAFILTRIIRHTKWNLAQVRPHRLCVSSIKTGNTKDQDKKQSPARILTIFGLNGGWTSLFMSFNQLMCLKNTWSLMFCSPLSPQPKRLAGCLVKNCKEQRNQAITRAKNTILTYSLLLYVHQIKEHSTKKLSKTSSYPFDNENSFLWYRSRIWNTVLQNGVKQFIFIIAIKRRLWDTTKKQVMSLSPLLQHWKRAGDGESLPYISHTD